MGCNTIFFKYIPTPHLQNSGLPAQKGKKKNQHSSTDFVLPEGKNIQIMLVSQMFSDWPGLVVATARYIMNQLKLIENLERMKNLETRDQTQHLSLTNGKSSWKGVKNSPLVSIAGKIVKQIIKQSIFKDLKGNNVIGSRQHGFSKKKSVRPISFTSLTDQLL